MKHEARDLAETQCCIVGAGPAGAVLGLLLARAGVPVTVVESHSDFDRDFRGDTIHPAVMEIMDQLGLAEGLLKLRHSKIHAVVIQTPAGAVTMAEFRRLRTPYPFITMLPQVDFLEFITTKARAYPNFRLLMGRRVEELVEEDGVIRGVRYRSDDGRHQIRAALTVGADGRGSLVRHLAGFRSAKTSPPMDVLWFRLPRYPTDVATESITFRVQTGRLLIVFDRSDCWQVAYVFAKGTYQRLREAGLAALRTSIAELAPEFADRVEALEEWKQVAVLSVESGFVKRWYRPGLLLIGDAAHIMSPVGGVGINLAIQDAVVAANVLAGPLGAGRVRLSDLAAVQRRRGWPTRVIQAFQSVAQKRLIAEALDSTRPFQLPLPLRLLRRAPILNALPARLIGFGLWRARVK